MRTLIGFTAISVFVAALAWGSIGHAATVGEEAPGFSLPTLSGETVTLDGLKGKVLLLNFWASWCTPCQEELPEFQKFHQKYHDRGFSVVGINIDKKQANAAKYVERFGLSFPVVLDPDSETIRSYRGRSMPISYLVDRHGVIRQVFFGFNPKKLPGMETAIKETLDATAQ
ncbi:MAG: TlpA disulfide reductase family protein [Nitrospirota bacterium]